MSEKSELVALYRQNLVNLFWLQITYSDGGEKMGQIKLTPEELRTSAVKYTNGSTDIDNVLTILTSEQETIRENWEGTAFESFDNQFTELKPKIQEFSQLLQDINTQLNSVADTIEQTDQDIAGKIGF